MGHQFYKLDPGLCICILGDPGAGSQRVKVRKLSGVGILLEPGCGLRENQYVYTSVVLKDGPRLALSGLVASADASGVFIEWSHSKPAEADRLDRTILDYLKQRDPFQAAAAAPAPVKKAEAPPKQAEEKVPVPPAEAGALDVTANIRKKARKVRSADLASRLDVVDVLDLGTLRSLIKESVDDSVAHLEKRLNEGERRRILEEAEETVKERIELFKVEKAGMEEAARLLKDELAKTQDLLEEERAKVISASQFTVSDKGMVELESRLSRMLGQALKKGNVDRGLEEEMRQVLLRLLDDERQRIREQAEEAQSASIALLEKKVGRLASSLKSAEAERDLARRRAQVLEASGVIGLKNISAAGMDAEDPDRERKLALLLAVVKDNREMRSLLRAEGRLPPMRLRPEPKEGEPAAKEGGAPEGPPAREEPGEDGGEPVKVPQLATGEGSDPDDPPWEPRGPAEEGEVKIKRPGG